MRWLFLSSFGILVGFLSLPGWISDIEILLWLFLSIFTAIIISSEKHKSLGLYCLGLGLIWAIGVAGIQVLFYPYFIESNPGIAESLGKLPDFLIPRLLPLYSAPIVGIALSLTLWLSVQIVRKLK